MERTSGLVAVVDDDTNFAELLTQYIGVLGFTATSVPPDRVENVAETLLEQDPAVVILDIELGVASGLDVAQHLRKLGYAGTVVAMTGMEFHERAGEGQLHSFDEYWKKPIDPDRVKAFLQEVA